MNLQPVKQSPHPAMWVTLWCVRCNIGTTDALADLDAAPGTYYCRPCAQYAPITEDGDMP